MKIPIACLLASTSCQVNPYKRASHRSNNVFIQFLEPVKILSKKEQKKLEEEEFERVLKEMGVKEQAKSTTEESKQSAATES
ncbi:MAG: hypothetical protein GY849_22165 [Deltaproteobacteria bacterium]|nr:hypothetical protein [Deltaproteobacteria bacterium]